MNIQLNLKNNQFIPKFFPYLFDYTRRWEFYYGGAGSGKSYFITEKIIVRCLNEPIRVVVCRRYGTTLRNTVFALFKEILDKWQIKSYVKIRETDFNIRFPNGSEIIMMGLDEETKLLSLANISTIWIEEAYEVEPNKVEQLNLRMRGQAKNQQLILSWNPISKSSWLYDFTIIKPPANSVVIHSTYRDNPFLNEEYVAAIDELETRNPQKYEIYGRGCWGIDAEGLVFQNWTIEDFNAMELAAQGYELRVGLDFGYIDATAIVATLYDKPNKTIYVFREFYKGGLQLDAVADAIHAMEIGKAVVWCDSAEPRSIEFLKKNGIAAKPCIKGADSKKARILFLQNHKIIIHPSCRNVSIEFGNFSYEKNKNDEYTENTTHQFSHTIDALGYAYSNIYKNTTLKTLDKSALGL